MRAEGGLQQGWGHANAHVRLPPLPILPQLKEMEGTLELVQGQRNELRQEVKDAKAALAEAERRMQVRAAARALAMFAGVVAGGRVQEQAVCRPRAASLCSSKS